MSTGIVTTAIVLIIGYVIVSRIVGLAFRFVAPLALLVLLGGAGVVSGLMPERSAAAPYASYGEAQHRLSADIGDLRLRDITDMAVDADGTNGRPKSWFIEIGEDAYEAEMKFLRQDIYRRDVELFTQRITAFERFRMAS